MITCVRGLIIAVALAGATVITPVDITAADGGAPTKKSVTVQAKTEAEALKLAEKQNSGWKAVSAAKTAPNDPKSMQWGVKMEKK